MPVPAIRKIFNKIQLKPSWLFLLLFPLQVFSQTKITGTVTETDGNLPLPYATVYVNGTTNGTITNPEGQFFLDRVIPPCEIVISHIGYFTEVVVLKHETDTTLYIKLKPRDVELGVVEVTDKNRREENIRHFKEHFLGTDYWGKNASIENDSVLVFHREKITESGDNWHESGILTADSSSTLFIVNTKGPLLVSMPLLGYKLYIDLIDYTEILTGTGPEYEFHTLGYFYFQPEKNTAKRKTNRFEKKRLEAYYNSDRHLCRSLFYNQLKENGYFVYFYSKNPETGLWERTVTGLLKQIEFEFDNHIIRTGDEAKIVGLKNRSFDIKYYELHNAPVNLNKSDGARPEISKIYFLKDTCTIRADGSRPDNSIMFGPVIGKKRVGAMLPNDFQPGKKE